jgi:hypothetical protein
MLADLCYDPTTNIQDVLTKNSKAYNITVYYTTCTGTSPFNSTLSDAAYYIDLLNATSVSALSCKRSAALFSCVSVPFIDFSLFL